LKYLNSFIRDYIFEKNSQKSVSQNIIVNITGSLLFLGLCGFPTVAIAKNSALSREVNNLFNSANQAYLSGDYKRAISDWKLVINSKNVDSYNLAVAYENIASVQRHLGFPGKSIQFWQESVEIHSRKKDWDSKLQLAAVLIDQSQAYNDLGQPRFSIPLIDKALLIIESANKNNSVEIVKSFSTSQLKQIAYFSFGNAYSAKADYNRSIIAYKKSLEARTLDKTSASSVISILTNLSQVYQKRSTILSQKSISADMEDDPIAFSLKQMSKKNHDWAISHAKKATEIQLDSVSLERFKALLQLFKLNKKHQLLNQATRISSLLPDSYQKIYALVELGRLTDNSRQSEIILQSAVKHSLDHNNSRVASFALGALGNYYEEHQRYDEALLWTRQAAAAARKIQAADSLYQWSWQEARILRVLGERDQSAIAYEDAIASLQLIRKEYAQAKTELAVDFQTKVEPVYREYLEILLANDSFSDLKRALEVRELLQLSELENFFQDDCFHINDPNSSEAKKSQNLNTAIITTIILPEQTHVIFQLPGGKLQKHSIDISKTKLEQSLLKWRYDLENFENNNYLNSSRQSYNMLISPFNDELEKMNINKLVFVNDGMFRNLPMTALHNGEFLLSKYAISNSLGLNLKLDPDIESKTASQALLFGLSEETEKSSALPYVSFEMKAVADTIPESNIFENQSFNQQTFDKEVSEAESSIIHIATHGRFTGTLEDSFLRTWDSNISLANLENILTRRSLIFAQKIKLLVLSACDTSSGNDRATLGMSGVALRSGVENTFGSLWSANDLQTAKLVDHFYQNWIEKKIDMPESLRQAQLKLIQSGSQHPSLWSGFILIQSEY